MPLPKVFGIENEYVIHCAGVGADDPEKFRYEYLVVAKLLFEFRRIFFQDVSCFPEKEIIEILARRSSSEKTTEVPEQNERWQDLPYRIEFAHGFMTPLGGRFYIDHGYFEGCTPECDDPFELIACERAQEELMCDLFEKHFGDHPLKPRLYKNVSDGLGHSQAAHRNFCVSADLWQKITSEMPLRLRLLRESRNAVTRETSILATWHAVEQIFCGAGAYRDECYAGRHAFPFRPAGEEGRSFRISGRSDFTERVLGDTTMERRPLINTRCEPLAGYQYGRYHCICGDATRSEWSSVFKIGLLALVLGMLEDDAFSVDCVAVHPCSAMHDISHDPTLQTPIRMSSLHGSGDFSLRPLELARLFLNGIQRYIGSHQCPPWASQIYEKADWVIWALEHQPELLESVLDWKIKERYCGKVRDPFGRHLSYHKLAGPTQLYQTLCNEGLIETVIPEEMIARRKKNPPETTRAYLRGHFIKHFFDRIYSFSSSWDSVVYRSDRSGLPLEISYREPKQLTRADLGSIFEEPNPPALGAVEDLLLRMRVLNVKRRL